MIVQLISVTSFFVLFMAPQPVLDARQKIDQQTANEAINTSFTRFEGDLREQIYGLSHQEVMRWLPTLFSQRPDIALDIPMVPPLMRWKGNRVSSWFGWRTHPVKGTYRFHQGVDLAGTRQWIRASAGGWVEKTGYDRELGNYIWIDHGNSYRTLYGHLESYGVRQGQRVCIGERIGILGKTGNATGYHLHYAIKKNKEYINPAPHLTAAYKLLKLYGIKL